MGHGTHACSIDVDRLRAVFGSGDRSLIAALDASLGDAMTGHDDQFRDLIDEGAPTLRQALLQIVAGEADAPDGSGFQYGYAIEFLCGHLGRWIEDASLIRDIEDLGLSTGLSNYQGDLLPVPEPDDFPDIRFLTADLVRREWEDLKDFDLTGEDEELQLAREEFRSWFREAAGRGEGLVTFTY